MLGYPMAAARRFNDFSLVAIFPQKQLKNIKLISVSNM